MDFNLIQYVFGLAHHILQDAGKVADKLLEKVAFIVKDFYLHGKLGGEKDNVYSLLKHFKNAIAEEGDHSVTLENLINKIDGLVRVLDNKLDILNGKEVVVAASTIYELGKFFIQNKTKRGTIMKSFDASQLISLPGSHESFLWCTDSSLGNSLDIAIFKKKSKLRNLLKQIQTLQEYYGGMNKTTLFGEICTLELTLNYLTSPNQKAYQDSASCLKKVYGENYFLLYSASRQTSQIRDESSIKHNVYLDTGSDEHQSIKEGYAFYNCVTADNSKFDSRTVPNATHSVQDENTGTDTDQRIHKTRALTSPVPTFNESLRTQENRALTSLASTDYNNFDSIADPYAMHTMQGDTIDLHRFSDAPPFPRYLNLEIEKNITDGIPLLFTRFWIVTPRMFEDAVRTTRLTTFTLGYFVFHPNDVRLPIYIPIYRGYYLDRKESNYRSAYRQISYFSNTDSISLLEVRDNLRTTETIDVDANAVVRRSSA